MVSFASYEIPREHPYSSDAQWVEHLQCDEGYVGDDGCGWEGKLEVQGMLAWHTYRDGSTEVDAKVFDWVCPRCGYEYSVEVA